MRRYFSILLLPFFFLTLSQSYAQINNFNAMNGTWEGDWINNYYSSTGSIDFVITVDENNETAHGEWDVGGNILGEPRLPFSSDIILTNDGFTVDFSSPIWGDIIGAGFLTGAFSGTAENCPNPNATAIASTGTFSTTSINAAFTFNWYGQPIDGTVEMTKLNPIETPTNLNGSEVSSVNLTWSDNSDNEDGWKLDRKTGAGGIWEEIADISAGTTEYLDETVEAETEYFYRVAGYNADTESEYSDEFNITTSPATDIEDNTNIPADYMLLQNYPSPFNPSTNIVFTLPRESHVKLSVYNVIGEEVAYFLDGYRNSGRYEVSFHSSDLTSGIYLLKMVATSAISGNQFIDIKKMIILK